MVEGPIKLPADAVTRVELHSIPWHAS